MFLTDNANNATLSIPVYMSTPLIYFPQELAYQISVATYIHMGCLAVSHGWYSVEMPEVLTFITR